MANGDKARSVTRLRLAAFASGCLTLAILILYLLIPDNASAEYRYTVEKIFQFGFFICMAAFLITLYAAIRNSRFSRIFDHRFSWLLICLVGGAFLAVPLLSPPSVLLGPRLSAGLSFRTLTGIFSFCWIAGSFCIAFGLFLLAARLNNALSSLLCLFASVALAFSLGETYYALTPQFLDGKWEDSPHSKYVLDGVGEPYTLQKRPGFGNWRKRPDNPNGAVGHKALKFDQVLFDVLYTIDEKDRRVTPAANPNPAADLLLFGCSFTFGFGLDDKDTWAWQLAKDLGPDWDVKNYSLSGFGAQQMLLTLEEKQFEAPTAPLREALFLAIRDQPRRNSGLFDLDTVTYTLGKDGEPVRDAMNTGGLGRTFVHLPLVFNGSQLVRELTFRLTPALVRMKEPFLTSVYIAMIAKSAGILKDDYATTLTVLIWPDIENISDDLKALGIPVIMVRDLLVDWETQGEEAYQIVPVYEVHPNKKAARELAAGLAAYYRGLEAGQSSR